MDLETANKIIKQISWCSEHKCPVVEVKYTCLHALKEAIAFVVKAPPTIAFMEER